METPTREEWRQHIETPGRTLVAWTPDYVVWKSEWAPFPERPYNVHPLKNGRVSGSGSYDLNRLDVEMMCPGVVL